MLVLINAAATPHDSTSAQTKSEEHNKIEFLEHVHNDSYECCMAKLGTVHKHFICLKSSRFPHHWAYEGKRATTAQQTRITHAERPGYFSIPSKKCIYSCLCLQGIAR